MSRIFFVNKPLIKHFQRKLIIHMNLSNTIRVIKSRRMRWVGPVARREDKINSYRVFVRETWG